MNLSDSEAERVTKQEVRRLAADDAQELKALRTEALERQPLWFSASLQDDIARSLEATRAALVTSDNAAIFGLFSPASLVGMVGVGRAGKQKRRHQVALWGLYVSEEIGAAADPQDLLAAALAWARACPGVEQVHVSVPESALEARALYRAHGFREWGLEPRALQWQGSFVDQLHLVLDLRDVPPALSSATPESA